jgi:hypothetical protein
MSEDIITKILDRNNLNEAFKRVKANKGASGIDDMDIEETKAYIKEHKNTIVWQLYNRKYQPWRNAYETLCNDLFGPSYGIDAGRLRRRKQGNPLFHHRLRRNHRPSGSCLLQGRLRSGGYYTQI